MSRKFAFSITLFILGQPKLVWSVEKDTHISTVAVCNMPSYSYLVRSDYTGRTTVVVP
jgi:hypothetical protein